MFTETLNVKYTPDLALVVYKKIKEDSQFNQNENAPDFHMETCHFVQKDGQYHLSAGTLVKEKQLNELAKFLNKREQKRLAPYNFRAMIPHYILYTNQEQDSPTVVWYETGVKEKLLFTRDLGIPDGFVELPNLLFKLEGHQLSVYAFTDKVLNIDSVLYQAPFHNTTDEGVCMGNVKIKSKDRTWEGLIEAAHHAFFNSLFSHIHGSNPVVEGQNLNLVLTKCIEHQVPFPKEMLKPLKIKLGKLIPIS